MGPAGAAPAGPKLRVLALHGYLQSAAMFRSRAGALRKALKRQCEFVFVDAPFQVDPSSLGGGVVKQCNSEEGAPQYGWWRASSDGPPREALKTAGWDQSLHALAEVMEKEGPFDGVLGFSQGGAAAAMLCAAIEQGRVEGEQFRFALLFGAFLPRDPALREALLVQTLPVTSLHFFGQNDALVVEARTRELAECFVSDKRTVVAHPQGHCVPSLKEVRDKVKAWVAEEAAAAGSAAAGGGVAEELEAKLNVA